MSQIYVIDGAGGNFLSAKTAQDLALVQFINTISGFSELEKQNKDVPTITNIQDFKAEVIGEPLTFQRLI